MLALVLGCLVYVLAINFITSKNLSIRGKANISMLTIYICGIVLWPYFWERMLRDNAYMSHSIPSLLWPVCALLIEVYLLKYHTLEEQIRRKGILSMDANAICSLTFALSSVLGSHRDECCQNIFMYGVLGLIAFVIPTPQAPSETLDSIIIETMQKVYLIYSTGLLLGGSMLLIGRQTTQITEQTR